METSVFAGRAAEWRAGSRSISCKESVITPATEPSVSRTRRAITAIQFP
jgi:hypothetical protein